VVVFAAVAKEAVEGWVDAFVPAVSRMLWVGKLMSEAVALIVYAKMLKTGRKRRADDMAESTKRIASTCNVAAMSIQCVVSIGDSQEEQQRESRLR